ncbi:unnamed protein product [Anisakis simplex]|uniref:AT-rich interactive domain-containing protein 1B-like n=1 Tax=Anisakis simplex TaxID=6269 RepID=A0A0M3K2J5_ANISI|nr:unnamed protein product [Anisakis simplex]
MKSCPRQSSSDRYPPAMSQPQSSSGRPPPQSPIIYPQGGPAGCPQPPQVQQAPPPQVAAQQRSLYAQAANQPMTVPSPQQPVPPQTPQTPQQPPPGIPLSQPQQYPPPPAYYQQKSQPLPGYPSSQPPMYRQQGPQSVPVRAYLSNQPSPMNSSPAYASK